MAFGIPICASCGSTTEIHEHHLVPRVRGGENGPTIWLCATCHESVHGLCADNFTLMKIGRDKVRAATGRCEGRKPAPEAHRTMAQGLRANGLTLRAIASELAVAGFHAPSGAVYGPNSIQCMLVA